jgi:hypothetical protein
MRSPVLPAFLLGSAALMLGAAAAPAASGDVDTTVAFELDHWFDFGATSGPVTLHRARIVRQTGAFTKSTFFRPGNNEFLATVQIQIEYSNSEKRDWKAHLDIVWLDGDGKPIDGYKGSEGLDGEKSHEKVTVTLSTLEYGLGRAKKLKIGISSEPD